MQRQAFVLLMMLASAALNAQTTESPFYEYTIGTMPLILEVPHGGTQETTTLSPRKEGNHSRDTGTVDFARLVSESLFSQSGKRPFLLINNLKRIYVDANHNISECETPAQRQYYQLYHGVIDKAGKDLLSRFPSGLFLDIHSGWNDFELDVYFGTSGGNTLSHLSRLHGPTAFSGEFSIQHQLFLKGYRIPGEGSFAAKPGPSGKIIRH